MSRLSTKRKKDQIKNRIIPIQNPNPILWIKIHSFTHQCQLNHKVLSFFSLKDSFKNIQSKLSMKETKSVKLNAQQHQQEENGYFSPFKFSKLLDPEAS